MNDVQITTYKVLFFQFFNGPVALKNQKNFWPPQEKVEMTPLSTNEGVLRSNSGDAMLMSNYLRLPRRGIKPRPSGFRDIRSTTRPLPLYSYIEFQTAVRLEYKTGILIGFLVKTNRNTFWKSCQDIVRSL